MRPDLNNIDAVVQRHLPSASRDGMESNGSRVLQELEANGNRTIRFPVSAGEDNRWSFRTALPIAAGLIVFVILSVAFIRQGLAPNNLYAVVQRVDGSLYNVTDGKSQAVTVGERIDLDTPLRTRDGAGAVLKLSDGALIQMHPESELSLQRVNDGVRIRLNDGSVNITPAKQPVGNLYLQNLEGTVPVVGALFQTARTVEPSPEPPQVFDVVSIRPSSRPVGGGGRGRGAREAGGGPLSPCLRIAVQLDPSRIIATRANVYALISVAYGFRCTVQGVISGGPGWISSDLYDIEALIPAGTPAYTRQELAEGRAPTLQKMLQNLLSSHFKLAFRRETKELTGYNLTVVNPAKLKLSEDQTGVTPPKPPVTDVPLFFFSGNSSMDNYADLLQSQLGRPVVDKTGLKGLYDLLILLPELADPLPPGDPGTQAALRLDELFPVKLEQQLGLKLEPTKAAVDTVVIENVEKPPQNE